ncbi:MAG: 3-oxoacyl-[acyl-carrier-protein] reductase [Dehalococcoidia bacterium]
MEMENRVSLVTGASRGIGRAIALKLAELGSRVAVNYVAIEESNKADADEVVKSMTDMGVEAMAVEADVRDSGAVKSMVEQVAERWGKIDILVNNAGINRDTLLLRMSDDAWDAVIDTNLRGAFLCTKYAVKYMMKQQWGRVISLSSVVGRVGNAGQSNYAASKGGIIAFTKSVAREMGSRNITVNAIAPGFIVTDMTNKLPPETRDGLLSMIPLARLGQPEDVAELVAFLAGEKAGYITGQVITIDGGAFP